MRRWTDICPLAGPGPFTGTLGALTVTALLFLGGIGSTEILVVLAVGLLIFGGRLPEVARSMGKSFMEFRRGLRGLTDELERDPDPDPDPNAPASPRLPAPEYPPADPGTDSTPADQTAPSPGPEPASPDAGSGAAKDVLGDDDTAVASSESPETEGPIEDTVARGRETEPAREPSPPSDADAPR